tara:strand:+ start:35 stop:673 length:639 start_codon:yes stop_codon:yes gene_type:complete
MARKKEEDEDARQSSLDAFLNTQEDSEEKVQATDSEEPNNIPAMLDLDNIEPTAVEPVIEETIIQPIVDINPLRSFEMPSSQDNISKTTPKTKLVFHDLEKMYPNPPIKDENNGLVIHRAVLHDLTGIGQLMDWMSDDHGAIVEIGRLMKRDVEFTTALQRLNQFIEGDLGGQIIQVTGSRLLFLPPGCRGLKGLDDEAFSTDAVDLGQRRF